jgi:hypothetical protein
MSSVTGPPAQLSSCTSSPSSVRSSGPSVRLSTEQVALVTAVDDVSGENTAVFRRLVSPLLKSES